MIYESKSKHWWFSGRMLACHAGGPGSIPGQCIFILFIWNLFEFKSKIKMLNECLGPYHVECTGSRPITEVKQRRARLVLGWVTAWEYRVF